MPRTSARISEGYTLLFASGKLLPIVLTGVPVAGRGCRYLQASTVAGFSLRQNSLEVMLKEIEDT